MGTLKMENFIEKAKIVKQRFGRRERVLESRGRKYDEVTSHMLWVCRRSFCRAGTRAILTLSNHVISEDAGRTLGRWRQTSVTSGLVSRVIMDLLLEYDVITVSQVEARCRRESVPVKRTLVTKIMNHAVEIDLLSIVKKTRDGTEYELTDLGREELIDRMVLKYTEPDVVKFARKVVMLDDIRREYEGVMKERNANPSLTWDAEPSLFEMALRADYDD